MKSVSLHKVSTSLCFHVLIDFLLHCGMLGFSKCSQCYWKLSDQENIQNIITQSETYLLEIELKTLNLHYIFHYKIHSLLCVTHLPLLSVVGDLMMTNETCQD